MKAGSQLLPGSPLWVRLCSGIIRTLPVGRYKAIHALSRFTPPPFLGSWTDDDCEIRFVCDLRDMITREVCFAGVYEPHIRAMLRLLLEPPATFVDVGANWGYFTLLSSKLVGSEGRVISIEPDPRVFPVLEQNVALNDLTNVECLQQAASDGPGTVTLYGYDESTDNWGRSSISPGRESDVAFEVQAVSLDELLQPVGRIDVMKMDIEGAEAKAVPGCESLLHAARIGVLLLEFHPQEIERLGQAVDSLTEILGAHGYRGHVIDDSLAATREFAYRRRVNPDVLLSPYREGMNLNERPQTIWTAPGVKLPF